MMLLDANLLIYAFRVELPQHPFAHAWLQSELDAGTAFFLHPLAAGAFLRLTTKSLGPLTAAPIAKALQMNPHPALDPPSFFAPRICVCWFASAAHADDAADVEHKPSKKRIGGLALWYPCCRFLEKPAAASRSRRLRGMPSLSVSKVRTDPNGRWCPNLNSLISTPLIARGYFLSCRQ
jgi:predicted nucleic acid-binding protein